MGMRWRAKGKRMVGRCMVDLDGELATIQRCALSKAWAVQVEEEDGVKGGRYEVCSARRIAKSAGNVVYTDHPASSFFAARRGRAYMSSVFSYPPESQRDTRHQASAERPRQVIKGSYDITVAASATDNWRGRWVGVDMEVGKGT